MYNKTYCIYFLYKIDINNCLILLYIKEVINNNKNKNISNKKDMNNKNKKPLNNLIKPRFDQ